MRTLDIILRQNLNNNVRVKHCYLTIKMNGKEVRIGLENFDAPYCEFFIEDGPWHSITLDGVTYDIQVFCYDNEMQVQICDIDTYDCVYSTIEGNITLQHISFILYIDGEEIVETIH